MSRSHTCTRSRIRIRGRTRTLDCTGASFWSRCEVLQMSADSGEPTAGEGKVVALGAVCLNKVTEQKISYLIFTV